MALSTFQWLGIEIKVSSIDGDSWYLYDSNVTEAPPPFPAFATSSHVPQADEDLLD